MRIKSKSAAKAEIQEEASVQVAEDGAVELTGTMFLTPGVYKDASEIKTAVGTSIPESLQELLVQLDPNTLPLASDKRQFLEQARQQAEQRVVMNSIGADAAAKPPVQKITNLAQLTPDQRRLLSAFLGEESQRVAKANYVAPETKTHHFDSPAELFNHVAQKLASTGAINLHEEELDIPKVEITNDVVVRPKEIDKPKVKEQVKDHTQQVNTLTRCPHCQLSLYSEPMAITEENKQNFILSIIHAQPYIEDRVFFGGNVTATLRGLTLSESDAIEDAIDSVGTQEDVPLKDKVNFYLRSYLAYALVKFKIGDKVFNYPKLPVGNDADDTVDQILRRCDQLTADLPNGDLFTLIVNDSIKFQYKCKKLTAMGLNSDFWKPIQIQ